MVSRMLVLEPLEFTLVLAPIESTGHGGGSVGVEILADPFDNDV